LQVALCVHSGCADSNRFSQFLFEKSGSGAAKFGQNGPYSSDQVVERRGWRFLIEAFFNQAPKLILKVGLQEKVESEEEFLLSFEAIFHFFRFFRFFFVDLANKRFGKLTDSTVGGATVECGMDY
jgi:hypothetical protein